MTDPTADLSDADVRAVCDEADRSDRIGPIGTHRDDRIWVSVALRYPDKRDWSWSDHLKSAVARLRAERAAKGTPDADPDPEPLTVERALDWLASEGLRIDAIPYSERTPLERRRHDLLEPLTVTDAEELAALLVEAAAGRVR